MFFSIFKDDKYHKSITEILTILDTDQSGTISLKELETLYPDAAHSLFSRFDLDHNGELDVHELKEFINSIELATEILNRLQAQVNFLFIFCFIISKARSLFFSSKLNCKFSPN